MEAPDENDIWPKCEACKASLIGFEFDSKLCEKCTTYNDTIEEVLKKVEEQLIVSEGVDTRAIHHNSALHVVAELVCGMKKKANIQVNGSFGIDPNPDAMEINRWKTFHQVQYESEKKT